MEPKIRFKGFEGEWKTQSLSDYNFSIIAGGDVDKKLLQNNGKYPVIANALTNDGILGYYMDSFRVNGPAVTVTGRGDIGVAIARHYSFTPVVRLLSIKSNHNVDFLANAINCYKATKESTGVPQLTTAKLQEYRIPIPKEMDEENAIASYFTSLDSQISASTSRLASLKQMKAASLQAMFPQEGETVPKIRFKGFEGEWKKVKFSDIACIFRGLTYSPNDIVKDGVRVLRSSNIDEDTFVLTTSDVFVSYECVNIDYIHKNDILITAANGSSRLVGKHTLVKKLDNKMQVAGGFMLRVISNESEFLNASMNTCWYKKVLQTCVAGGNGAIGNLNKNDLSNTSFYIPKEKEERDAIASYFTSLDHQISLQTQRLEKLKQIKSACLDKMFV